MKARDCIRKSEPVVSTALLVVCGIPLACGTASIKFSCDEKFAQIESTEMEAAEAAAATAATAAAATAAAAVACLAIIFQPRHGAFHIPPFRKA